VTSTSRPSVDLADNDELIGELARRGHLILSTGCPVGLALEDVDKARRALPLDDYPDRFEGEETDLDLSSVGLVEGWCDQFSPPSWTAQLYRAFVRVVWAWGPESRRQALVELAALAVRWVEALDAREGGER
jgi:hypothetical protein